jgi:hypothetical protein
MKSMQKILSLAFLLVSIHCTGQNIMIFHGDSVAVGDNAMVRLDIENADPFSAFQFDIVIPGGFSYIDNSADLTARKADHSLVVSLIGNDTLRVIAFSPSNSNFNGYTGEILHFSLNTSESPGNYNLETNNCILANNQGNNIITNVINGQVWLFVPVSANQINAQQNFKVYPNPSNGSFNLDLLTTRHDDLLLTIHNLHGQIVFEKDLSSAVKTIRFNLAELLQETHYVLKIQSRINHEIVYQQILIKI